MRKVVFVLSGVLSVYTTYVLGVATVDCSKSPDTRTAVQCLQNMIEHIQQPQYRKVCRAVWENHMTDGIVVPDTWTADNCKHYAVVVGGPTVYLGCMSASDVVYGSKGVSAVPESPGLPPGNNCSW